MVQSPGMGRVDRDQPASAMGQAVPTDEQFASFTVGVARPCIGVRKDDADQQLIEQLAQ